ncbi:MAG: response regulator [bacterium]|nr:response regulator [bacterium]
MNKIRVLFADDRAAERADIVECLNRDERFSADGCFLSRADILSAINASSFDLLLLDVELWGGDNTAAGQTDQMFGLNLLNELHSFLGERNIKTVLLTIHDVAVPGSKVGAAIVKSVNEGVAQGYLRKPFIPSQHSSLLVRFAGSTESKEDLL